MGLRSLVVALGLSLSGCAQTAHVTRDGTASSYKGRALVVALSWGGATSTITLTPDAAGLGGGTVSTDDGHVELNWVSAQQLRVTLSPKHGATTTELIAVGHAEVRSGDEVLTVESREETL